jgi:ArsR family transcriptional regulator
MNMKKLSIPTIAEQIAAPVAAIASPQRISILLAIGQSEACVCHLESALGWRQACISQHLMALRKAEVLEDRREGRYVYYRLKDPAYLELIAAAAQVCGLAAEAVLTLAQAQAYPACECPHCAPAVIPIESLPVKAAP